MNPRRDPLAWATIALLVVQLAAATGLAALGAARHRERADDRAVNRQLAAELGLGDLALWSDASYCRHPTLSMPISSIKSRRT